MDHNHQSMQQAMQLNWLREINAELIVIHILSTKLGGYEHTPKPLLFGLPATPSSVNNIIETSEQEAQRWLIRIKQQLLEDKNN